MESYMPSIWKRILSNFKILIKLVLQASEEVTLSKDAIVVVLDVIEPYRRLWSETHAARLCEMVNRARRNGNKIVFTRWARTRFYPSDAIARMSNPHWSHFVSAYDLDEDGSTKFIHPGLIQSGDTVVNAIHSNFLAHEKLDLPPGVPLLLTGMWTESCVLNTARGATEDNRDVLVYAPACAGHACLYALWTIESLYGKVVHRLKWRD